MTRDDILAGVLLDEVALSLDEMACACAVEPNWVVERVEAGFLGDVSLGQITRWQFTSTELARARRLIAVERDFDANPELAALVADLIEEVERLKARLNAAGLPLA
ncbi:MAG TPA: chaperone modulator CbpM [Azonexus sp.]|jgi:chaperone modulatory protein CbpM|nr:chaperone modulator CbpM [Azonexus sp.]